MTLCVIKMLVHFTEDCVTPEERSVINRLSSFFLFHFVFSYIKKKIKSLYVTYTLLIIITTTTTTTTTTIIIITLLLLIIMMMPIVIMMIPDEDKEF